MFKKLGDAFKIPNLRKRIGFTFLMLIVVRLGCLLPVPGVDSSTLSALFSGNDALNFFDSITGGSFSEMSVFALNITPYITASIIIQLLTIAFPKLEEMQKDGEQGRKKLNKATRYLTVGLALFESIAMTIGFGRSGYLVKFDALHVIVVVASLTAGSAVIMWLGEQITDKGIGNGISIVLTVNIISRIPADLANLWSQFVAGKTVAKGILAAVIIIAIIVAVVALVVVLQMAERQIPMQYASAAAGGRSPMGASKTHMPMRVNTAGVIPVIFAQSILSTPVIICTLLGKTGGTGFWGKVLKGMSQQYWFNKADWVSSIGAVVYVLLIIAFAYFYTSITFNPVEVAENLKRQRATIPGIRPGKPTSDYLTNILNNVIMIGALGLAIVAIIPLVFNGMFGAKVSFGGTSIIIIVGVVIETLKQVESQMMVRNYKGFLD